jgi:plasmid stability protein
MKTNIQIRGVPEKVHEKVRRRAASRGMSMSEYLLDLIQKDLAFPTPEEFQRRLNRIPPTVLDRPAAEDIRELREERERRRGSSS